MSSVPWPPWAMTNRTEQLSPAQIERILQMHKESKQNALIYVLVVLVLYLMALAVLIGRYLQQGRDPASLLCIGEALQRCTAACCNKGQSQQEVKQELQQPGTGAGVPVPPAHPALLAPPPPVLLPRIVHQPPPSDEASSETSSSPPSSEDSLSARCGGGRRCYQHKREDARELAVSRRDGNASPAVVRVLVCDLQDLQDTQV